MKLNELRDNEGATKRRMRVGRGPGSGKGKMGGRGIKGQTSRSGVAIKGYEGGQMPIHRRLPKRGFTNIFKKSFAVLNLGTLQTAVEAGKLKAGETVTEDLLVERNVLRRKRDGVRLLARGTLSTKLDLEISGASAAAVAAVEKAGGSIKVAIPPKAKQEAEQGA
ncbi:MAG: 50S ribosomal protein L15 [Neomegalonema sp.]|nr:50S ribosomal protein L15 [Neomegalonema sp.]